MRCPFCAHDDSQVKDSRPTEDNTAIRRRRQCESCGARFTTFERVQLREIVVLKRGDQREPFNRAKLEQSVALACRKRAIAQERLDQLVSGIQRQIETLGAVQRVLGAVVGAQAVAGPVASADDRADQQVGVRDEVRRGGRRLGRGRGGGRRGDRR